MALRRLRVALALVVLVAVGCGGRPVPPSVTVGSTPDVESTLLAHLYAAALRYYGAAAHVESAPDPVAGLDTGTFGVVPGFTGRLLYRFQPDAVARSDAQVYRDLLSALPEGVAAGDYAMSTDDKPALAVTESTAQAWGRHDVTALSRHCADVVVGSVPGRRVPGILGNCRLSAPRDFSDDAALFDALRTGLVNAAWTSTAAARVPSSLVVLGDRTALIPAENLVPLYRRNELGEQQVRAINELAGVVDTAALADMRAKVTGGADPAAVADSFLAANPLGR
jgi:glycine betaine/choline ABC-type transport system substrate-binding protein